MHGVGTGSSDTIQFTLGKSKEQKKNGKLQEIILFD
jgi:hypothetical protein